MMLLRTQIMTVNFDAIEDMAKRYVQSKHHKGSDSKEFAIRIIDCISSSYFKFPLQKGGVVSNGTTSYIYINGTSYPNLFEFISEILHSKIPITINNVTFGPGEIIVDKGNEHEAEQELTLGIKELQKLVHAKRAEIIRS